MGDQTVEEAVKEEAEVRTEVNKEVVIVEVKSKRAKLLALTLVEVAEETAVEAVAELLRRL
jgi:hypothetical protein